MNAPKCFICGNDTKPTAFNWFKCYECDYDLNVSTIGLFHKSLKERRCIVAGSKIIYAGAKYEVAEVRKLPHGWVVGIYDEPPSKHVDWLNIGSVELAH